MKTFFLSLLVSTSALAANPSAPEGENPALLLEGQREITSLTEMQKLGLTEASTKIDLWSGSYWPIYQGSLGVRYRDPEFRRLIENDSQWDKHKELHDKTPVYTYTGKENLLSPSEKYDLLVGDTDMTLTKYAWELGEKNNVTGSVKTWRGICDGWASASQKMPRPVKSVTLKSPNGIPLTFYPEDIKALGSLMYARSQGAPIFIGKRCRNQVIGLFTGACAETNPATFHLAMVNRIGNLKKSFVADVSPGSQVWNYPVESYKVTYYNVFDNAESQNFEEVKELWSKKNRFKRSMYRNPNTYAFVGVTMIVNFRDLRDANLLETDGPAMDKIMTMTYVYDLELDQNNNIIGGESFSKNLPDFIWAPNDSKYPKSDAEEKTPYLSVVELAKASSKKGQPLASVIEKLFEMSK